MRMKKIVSVAKSFSLGLVHNVPKRSREHSKCCDQNVLLHFVLTQPSSLLSLHSLIYPTACQENLSWSKPARFKFSAQLHISSGQLRCVYSLGKI